MIRQRPRSPASPAQRGQVLVLTALFLVVLLLTGALAIDYGTWLSARREYQAVADAAALAGGSQLASTGLLPTTPDDHETGAVEALAYLSDQLGLGIDRTWAHAHLGAFRNQTAPFVASHGNDRYCIWIWTPTPSAGTLAGTDPTCAPTVVPLYSPAKFPNSSHRIFVRVQSSRPGYLARVRGIDREIVGAMAVAGPTTGNYAVLALKPRTASVDTVEGITITGGSTLEIPVGDLGGNYTIKCAGTGSRVVFPDPALEQTVDLGEPESAAGCDGQIVGGSIQPMPDWPAPDPAYFGPRADSLPTWCSGPVSDECREPSGGGTATWSTYSGPIPSTCTLNHAGDLQCNPGTGGKGKGKPPKGGAAVIYPGKYRSIAIADGAVVTLSPTCEKTDVECSRNHRDGVFYLHSDSKAGSGDSVAGIDLKGTLQGCGVLLVLDPLEPGRLQLHTTSGSTLLLNTPQIPGCSMRFDPTTPGGSTLFPWYGYGSPYTNPVSIWVRPDGDGYGISAPKSGSNVITILAGTTLWVGGAIYGPEDDTKIAGNPSGSGVGQIVAWTITYDGGSTITQTFAGTPKGNARLWQ